MRNLPKDDITSRDEVAIIFEDLGYGGDKIKQINVNFDELGNFNGTVLLVFYSSLQAEKCVRESDECKVNGRQIYLDFVVPLSELKKSATSAGKWQPCGKPRVKQQPVPKEAFDDLDRELDEMRAKGRKEERESDSS